MSIAINSIRWAHTRNCTFIAIALMCINSVVSAQVFEHWVSYYHARFGTTKVLPNQNDFEVDPGGYVVVCGDNGGASALQFAASLHTGSGALSWETIRKPNSGFPHTWNSIALDLSRNVYFTGGSISAASGNNRISLCKYAPGGFHLWERFYETESSIVGGTVLVGTDAQPVVGTQYVHSQETSGDLFVIKYTEDGEVAWSNQFNSGGSANDSFNDMDLDSKNNIILFGGAATLQSTGSIVVKYSPDGVQSWTKSLSEAPWAMVVDKQDNVIIATRDASKLLLYKFSPSGDVLWNTEYEFIKTTYQLKKLVVDSTGRITAVVRNLHRELRPTSTIGTLHYSTNGALLWFRDYTPSPFHSSEPDDAECDIYGNVYITGASYVDQLYGSSDVVTLAYSKEGNVLWQRQFNGRENFNDYASLVEVDRAGSVYVSCTSFSYGSTIDCELAIVKYSDKPTSIDVELDAESTISIDSPFPNPTNQQTSIACTLAADSFITLSVCNALGEVVDVIASQFAGKGVHHFVWDATTVTSGEYFVRLNAADEVKTQKLTIIK